MTPVEELKLVKLLAEDGDEFYLLIDPANIELVKIYLIKLGRPYTIEPVFPDDGPPMLALTVGEGPSDEWQARRDLFLLRVYGTVIVGCMGLLVWLLFLR